MTITFKSGDLFLDEAEALVNTVNCVGVMGKGVALEFRNRWPENFKVYKKACDAKELRPGRMLVFEDTNLFEHQHPRFIINFPTKDHWKAKSKIEYIVDGLDALVKEIERLKITSIALPPLGCGNGGLDWQVVRPMIVDSLSSLERVEVSIYGPLDGVDEPEHVETGLKMTFGRAVLLKAIASLESHFGGVVDRLSLQKIAYLLQAMGVPLRLEFDKNLYGPHSDAFKKALLVLDNYKLISGFQGAGRETHVTRAGYAAAEDYLKSDESSEAVIYNLNALIEGFETPYGLELLTTVHSLAASMADNVDVDLLVDKMMKLERNKRNVFSEAEIHLAFNRLVEDKLLSGESVH